ncbi:AMP-dependent synthetase/ligase [Kordiimonas marina]|uniref:AMP-dependent synthetase/ligase n=1 Tax=Kordiimonas marina TaxID=2872312 RepID=UPI001FF1D84F|nr:AMP-binding protein [Kordiimonas marina]MCJ9427739.1 AMP-binding protein [Kordiimonas marina]
MARGDDGMELKTALDNLNHWATVKPDEPWLVDLKGGEEQPITWAEAKAEIEAVAAALAHRLPGTGRKAALLSRNRAHWILADLAILRSGHMTVPVFTTMRPDTFRYVLDFSDTELLFLGEATNWELVKPMVPDHVTIVTLPGVPESEGNVTWDALVQEGKGLPIPNMPDRNEPATVIFTSGTTGKPKGVMHSLQTLAEATYGLTVNSDTEEGWRFFSYLPLAHLAERLIIELHCLASGGVITFNEGLESFTDDLRAAKSDYFFGVPRIWEKLVQGVLAGVGGDAAALKAMLTGENAELVAAGIREKLGFGSVRQLVSTSAPTPPVIKEWFNLFGLEFLDGYGQTEILPITTTPKGCEKRGSVGRPSAGIEVRITDEGELIARGPGCSLGYYKAPDKTAETFRDGWVYTGDRAEIDEDGYVTLKGRVKETFKTAKGKYVAPGPIETQFLQSDLIEQAVIVGHGLPQPVLLIVASPHGQALPPKAFEADMRQLIADINAEQEHHAQIGAVILAAEPWTIENGVLTHTMKIRRDRILDRFGAEIEDAASYIGSGHDLHFRHTGL